MEIESHVSVPGKNLVKVEFKLGTESYTIDSINGDTHNVQDDDVPDQILSNDDASPVKPPKKTKI
ncbi:hypothetical protein AtNW77_Chr1g0046511 [Arabidopsis thaliana]|uniref:T2E6.9 n=2 Tax=Arabidopsis TaxID=3701 RepID=Q9FZG0_ARATH|nr:uncharacterized protein AT1G47813 [Arabidopsis thaliana]AAF99804.1 T2E6.9 [Arabidopsis thaliana]AEE32217.1 hypothetical protein AT1G47813 [Arabidopsis thaliana]KAG7648883.1 hypothetical protein ISN45_At01g039700 [Arabidopsis thaliana x Arabidopsis arenosa]|eukprot:NP_175216.1 hypothetical protein AT1G47813 [Arabidopsis thaliana]